MAAALFLDMASILVSSFDWRVLKTELVGGIEVGLACYS